MAIEWPGALARLLGRRPEAEAGEDAATEGPSAPPPKKESAPDASSFGRALLGAIATPNEPVFPQGLIGGGCPRVVGSEEDVAWNAAAEASDSERVHVVWQASGDRIWYLAVRSSELASTPRGWCPFAALLPGMADAAPPPICYVWSSEESAAMMTVLPDGLQIHRGTSSVVRAKAERVARELGGATVVELTPEMIASFAPVPWMSLSLFENRARRILATFSIAGALAATAVILVVWLIGVLALFATRADYREIEARNEQKSVQLMQMVQSTRASPMREQLAKFSDLNDGLLALNGLLEVYQIKSGKVLWKAVVPPNVTSDRINEMGGQTLDTVSQGVLIGNSRDALNMGQK